MDNFDAWQRILSEWRKVQRMKKLNQRLYDHLGGSIIYVLNYADKNNIPLLNSKTLYDLVDKAENIIDEINLLANEASSPTRNQHDYKHEDDSTEPNFLFLLKERNSPCFGILFFT
jgi:hypothetical protein